jgi:hypothetical protein
MKKLRIFAASPRDRVMKALHPFSSSAARGEGVASAAAIFEMNCSVKTKEKR